jgi:tripartite-type tricarboxylate transporter receptor subunit TctC
MFNRVLCLLLPLMFPVLALGQSGAPYPSRPAKIVVPYPAGGLTDTVGRLAAAFMEKRFNQSFIVENRPGASGLIGASAVVKSPADGYNLLLTASGMLQEEVMNSDWPLRVDRDMTPISILTGTGYVVVVANSVPAKSLREFVAYAKANPGKLNEAAPGNRNAAFEILKDRLGIPPIELVMYKGGSAAIQAVVAGEAQVITGAASDWAELDKAGKAKIIAYTENERHPLIPQVPTVNESGVGISDFNAGFWLGLSGPPGLPADITDKLNAASQEMVRSPDFQGRTTAFGMHSYYLSAVQARDRMLDEVNQLRAAAAHGVKFK